MGEGMPSPYVRGFLAVQRKIETLGTLYIRSQHGDPSNDLQKY